MTPWRRVLFPAAVQAGAGSHYRTLPYGWRYGHLVGTAAAQVLGQSRTTLAATFTTAADMIVEVVADGLWSRLGSWQQKLCFLWGQMLTEGGLGENGAEHGR